jgi:hypothetical protein
MAYYLCLLVRYSTQASSTQLATSNSKLYFVTIRRKYFVYFSNFNVKKIASPYRTVFGLSNGILFVLIGSIQRTKDLHSTCKTKFGVVLCDYLNEQSCIRFDSKLAILCNADWGSPCWEGVSSLSVLREQLINYMIYSSFRVIYQ